MRTVATITTVFIIKFRCIDFCLIERKLLRTFCWNQRADSGAGELELQVIGFNSYYYSVIFDGGNSTDDAAGSNDLIAGLQFRKHLLLPLLLPLHRHKKKKIKDDRYEDVRREESDRIRGLLLLKE
ncbi:MAG TPA: hypothetical protein VKB79_29600 [Bryobacteraceae bacterium]|nr:hypothetical protein [Bryobacteraceae bacterium]